MQSDPEGGQSAHLLLLYNPLCNSMPSRPLNATLRLSTPLYPLLCPTTHAPLCPFKHLYAPLRPSTALYAPLRPSMRLFTPLCPSITLYVPLRPYKTLLCPLMDSKPHYAPLHPSTSTLLHGTLCSSKPL